MSTATPRSVGSPAVTSKRALAQIILHAKEMQGPLAQAPFRLIDRRDRTVAAATIQRVASHERGRLGKELHALAGDGPRARRAAVDSRLLPLAMHEPTTREVVHLEKGWGRSSSGGR
jgi:hypothetical protein